MLNLSIISSLNQHHPIKQSTNQHRHTARPMFLEHYRESCRKVSALAGAEGTQSTPNAGQGFGSDRKGMDGAA